jgi:two-component system chemotaxis response regulator CheY
LSQKKARVLIVDDNEVVRRTLRGVVRQDQTLEFIGEASDGGAALEAVRSLKPDIVCLDVQMPGLDGLAVLQQIRETSKETRVVIVSGHPTGDVVAKALELGAAGFVVKPFNARKVLDTIHSALERDDLK